MAFPIHTRSKIWPKNPLQWGMFIVTLVLIPTIYIYEMFTVYPTVWEHWPNFQKIISFGGIFVFTNIVANFVGLIVTDTQVPPGVMSPSSKPFPNWHYCEFCVSYVPPRSWHCKFCKVCILKRDHHCLFGGCCVGHFNSRFFIMFLMYTFIGTLYSVLSDTMFLIDKVDFMSPSVLIKIGFPAFAYIAGFETLANECYILLYIINWAALIFVTVMLRFHVHINLKGQVTHDVSVLNLQYDLGKMQNVKEVMGIRWYLAWVFPLISSPLPRNGLEWDTVEEWRVKCQRNITKSK